MNISFWKEIQLAWRKTLSKEERMIIQNQVQEDIELWSDDGSIKGYSDNPLDDIDFNEVEDENYDEY